MLAQEHSYDRLLKAIGTALEVFERLICYWDGFSILYGIAWRPGSNIVGPQWVL